MAAARRGAESAPGGNAGRPRRGHRGGAGAGEAETFYWLKQLPVFILLSRHERALAPLLSLIGQNNCPSGSHRPARPQLPLLAPPLSHPLPPHWLHARVESPSTGREDAARPVAMVTSRPCPGPGPWRDGGRRWGWRGAQRGAGTGTGVRTGARTGARVGATTRAAHRAAATGAGRAPQLPACSVAAGGARGQDPGPPLAQGRPPPPPAGADGQRGSRWAAGSWSCCSLLRPAPHGASGGMSALFGGRLVKALRCCQGGARQEWAGGAPGGDEEKNSYLVPWSACHSLEPVAAWFGPALVLEERDRMFH